MAWILYVSLHRRYPLRMSCLLVSWLWNYSQLKGGRISKYKIQITVGVNNESKNYKLNFNCVKDTWYSWWNGREKGTKANFPLSWSCKSWYSKAEDAEDDGSQVLSRWDQGITTIYTSWILPSRNHIQTEDGWISFHTPSYLSYDPCGVGSKEGTIALLDLCSRGSLLLWIPPKMVAKRKVCVSSAPPKWAVISFEYPNKHWLLPKSSSFKFTKGNQKLFQCEDFTPKHWSPYWISLAKWKNLDNCLFIKHHPI